jgi:hypothetical protein
MRISLLFLLVCAPFVGAQTFSFGVKGGGFFTQPAEGVDDSHKYAVGPMVEVGFGSRLAVEGNALYSRFGSSLAGGVIRGHSVEFPVLGKYYFADKGSATRPFVSSGFAFRNIWFDNDRVGRGNVIRSSASTEPAVGAVFGAGVTFRASIFKLAPEVRYTRWGGYNYPSTNPNQLQALLGITF